MYSFEPNEEQSMLIDAIRRYALDDLRTIARDSDESGALPQSLIEKGWELGYLQASIPEAYGGFGERSVVTGVLAVEEMAYGDLSATLAVMAPALFAIPILMAGSEEQKETYIPAVIDMEWKAYTAGFVEPKVDFDPNAFNVSAKETGDVYLINGAKTYVPFAADAEAMILYANLDGVPQGFIVPMSTPGIAVGERQKLMGLHALPVYSVEFSEMKLPKENRLGGTDGHDYAQILDASRVATAAMAVGVSKAAFEYARDYAKDRDVFGVKVAQKQSIAFMLAEMATEIEAIRLLVWEAAWCLDTQHEEGSKKAYLALLGAVDMAMMVTDRAVQILGGHGYIREHPVEMWMRNGRGFSTFTGMAIV